MLNLKHEDQRGYTLVELVVVIATLGILAIIAVPMANNFLEGSEGPAYNADVATVQAAVNANFPSTRRIPPENSTCGRTPTRTQTLPRPLTRSRAPREASRAGGTAKTEFATKST